MTVTEISSSKEEKQELIRLAAYCRVSTNSTDQLHSYTSQIRHYSEYTLTHPEYELVDIYADEGLTGTDISKRDEQKRLIRDCKRGKIDRIITKSVSRFARNAEELLVTLRMLKELGVSVYFEEQGIDTDKLNAEMIVTFPGIIAQQESITISQNMRWSYQKRMASGEFNTYHAPFGYELVNGELIPKDGEMQIVQRIFSLYTNGVSTRNIAVILNQEGVERQGKKNQWSAMNVKYILHNERYMGEAVLQKRFTTETLPFKQEYNRGQKPKYHVENSNPVIIEKDVFETSQQLMRSKAVNDGKTKEARPLAKMLRCPDCGRLFRWQRVRGKIYWVCSGWSAGETDCQKRRVREEMVYDAFARMVEKLRDYRVELIETLIRQIEAMQDRGDGTREKVQKIDKQMADLSAKNLVLARLHNSRILSAADYAAQSAQVDHQICELRVKRKKELAEDEDAEWVEQLKELSDAIENSTPSNVFNEQLFDQIVDRVIVVDNTKLTFRLLGGIELTEPIAKNGRCKMR